MTLVYLDCAGEDAGERCAVAAGIVVSGERIWTQAASEIALLKSRMPVALRRGFSFRATAVMNNPRYDTAWPLEQRQHMLEALMQLPRKLAMPFVWSAALRAPPPDAAPTAMERALADCLGAVALFARSLSPEGRPEKVIAHTRAATSHLMDDRLPHLLATAVMTTLRPESLVTTALLRSRLQQVDAPGLLSDLQRRLQFSYRSPAWMLQVSDALAYGLARMHGAYPRAERKRFARLIFGPQVDARALDLGDQRGSTGIASWDEAPPGA